MVEILLTTNGYLAPLQAAKTDQSLIRTDQETRLQLVLQVRLKAIRCMLAMLSVSSGSPHSPSVALRDPSRAPMLGFLFSILLKAAEEEVQAGLTGSQALAAAALETVQYLSQAVDSGDALAFVVPGLASGLSKILIAAGEFPFASSVSAVCLLVGHAHTNVTESLSNSHLGTDVLLLKIAT